MNPPVPLLCVVLMLPRLWLAAKTLRLPLSGPRALLCAGAGLLLSLAAAVLVLVAAPALLYVGSGVFLYSLESPVPAAPLAGLLVLSLSAAVPLLPGILLEYILLLRPLGNAGAVKAGSFSLAYSLLLFMGAVSLGRSLHAGRVAGHGSTYLAPEWGSCASDEDCVVVRYGCDSYMGTGRAHEQEASSALYAMAGDPRTMNCSASEEKGVRAYCLQGRCTAVEVAPGGAQRTRARSPSLFNRG